MEEKLNQLARTVLGLAKEVKKLRKEVKAIKKRQNPIAEMIRMCFFKQ